MRLATLGHAIPPALIAIVGATALVVGARDRTPRPSPSAAESPGSTGGWFDCAGAKTTLDRFADTHGGQAPLVISADDTGSGDQDLLCTDSPPGNVDTHLSVDLPAWVASHLRADTRDRAVGGLSYGGTRACELAVRHPALFSTFLDFSGEKQPMRDTKQNAVDEVFGGDTAAYDRQDPLAFLAERRFPGSAGVLVVGADDQPYPDEQKVVAAACEQAGMLIEAGGHDRDVWTAAFDRNLPRLAERMGPVRR
jgi:S-formylglutathione hydrolase FrmB